jgi:hypothetical protein
LKRTRILVLMSGLFFIMWLPGCAGPQKNAVPAGDSKKLALQTDRLEPGRAKCLATGGRVITESYPDGTSAQLCLTEVIHTMDDGGQVIAHRCPLEKFYDDTCDADAVQDKADAPSTPQAADTVSASFHEKVREIMATVKNTGYAHNKNGNFSLVPDYKEIWKPQTEYNLFLDCSGFVGYYVIQGLAPRLYQVATPSQYACQDRPLAADFADLLKKAPEVGDDHPAALKSDFTSPVVSDNICWGQVKHIRNARPGDVIVYKHPENVLSTKKSCDNGKREVHEVKGNTGHILFVHGVPAESNRCKENPFSCGIKQKVLPGEWQWVVAVADSTTAPHMADSRRAGINQSDYKGHSYTAWEKGSTKGCVIERCKDGSYHRSCFANKSSAVEFVVINTVHPENATGIGVGKMYIGPDLKSYRSSFTADSYHHKNKNGETEQVVFIGRPIKCK